ncbi:MAG: methyltransferase domain-containing protein, partial [Deltaproteobacteria bacterium]|nr:methyltransferase domain-containing protein [Deltaproteobacteria bacterium]
FIVSRIIQVAVRIGMFDKIETRGSTSQKVASSIDANPRATELFLNALVAIRLLSNECGKYFNTEISKTYLVKDSPKYFGGMIIFEHNLWDMWGNLEDSVRTGMPRREPDMFQIKEDETEKFILAMHSLVRARGDAEVISGLLDLSWASSLIDIGSGPGTYPIEFIKKYPKLKITIFDLPGTLSVTRKILEKEDKIDQITLFEGDYKKNRIPDGFDVAFLSNIIHSEDEKTNQTLMKNIYEALKTGGLLVIKDHILNEDLTSPAVGAIFSITMLLATNGRDYSFNEVSTWLEDAGFKSIEWEKLPKPLDSSMITARK